MSVGALLDELERAGIRLSRDGDDLIAEIQPGACLDPYREHIVANKPTLLAMLDLQEQIVAAATVEPAAFDRPPRRRESSWSLSLPPRLGSWRAGRCRLDSDIDHPGDGLGIAVVAKLPGDGGREERGVART